MYLASVIAASVASLAVHPESAAHGSSAIVLALIGALICKYGLMGAQLSTRARWKLALLIILAGLLSYPINPSSDVDYAAHAGGLVAGMLLGGLLSSAFFAAQPRQRRWLWAGTALALALGCAVIRRNNHYVIPLEAALHDWDPRKPDETLRAVDPILQQRPLSRTANLMAADAYLRKADYANAEGAARRVLASGRDNDLAIYVLGMAEIKTGRCQEAHDMAQEKLMSHDNGESWPWTQRLSRVRCGEKETTGDK